MVLMFFIHQTRVRKSKWEHQVQNLPHYPLDLFDFLVFLYFWSFSRWWSCVMCYTICHDTAKDLFSLLLLLFLVHDVEITFWNRNRKTGLAEAQSLVVIRLMFFWEESRATELITNLVALAATKAKKRWPIVIPSGTFTWTMKVRSSCDVDSIGMMFFMC